MGSCQSACCGKAPNDVTQADASGTKESRGEDASGVEPFLPPADDCCQPLYRSKEETFEKYCSGGQDAKARAKTLKDFGGSEPQMALAVDAAGEKDTQRKRPSFDKVKMHVDADAAAKAPPLEPAAEPSPTSRDRGQGQTPLASSLQSLAAAGNLTEVRRLLDGGSKVGETDEMKRTALHHAAMQQNVEVVSLLLERRAHVIAPDVHGHTPLHVAAVYGNAKAAECLLKSGQGATINAPDSKIGRTPLHIAASSLYSNAALVQFLINEGADANAICTRSGCTPLHEASGNGRIDCVKLLLQLKASADAEDVQGRTPLHHAASKGHPDVVEVLLESGAEANRPEKKSGMSPLHLAAIKGDIFSIDKLMDYGAKSNLKTKGGRTPLDYARNRGDTQTVKYLTIRNSTSCCGGKPNYKLLLSARRAIV